MAVDDPHGITLNFPAELKEKAKPIHIGVPNLLTQKLGLSAYANTDSEESDEDGDSDGGRGNGKNVDSAESDVDSEEELKVKH